MKFWLARHAQPLVAPGICYGALNVPADTTATRMAAQALARVLPTGIELVSSPLQRCEQLAHVLQGIRPDLMCKFDSRLAEMNFGLWEGQCWNTIARAELDGWATNFKHWRCGGAECVDDVMRRVAAVWDETQASGQACAWLTHAGVIRAASLIAQGQRQLERADQWPVAAPAFGQWLVLEEAVSC